MRTNARRSRLHGLAPLTGLLVVLLAGPAAPDASVDATAGVPCKTVDDCWLDEDGHAVARPRRLRGRALPRGDCGKNLRWLRNRLSCDEQRCVATHVGDRC